jgi:hypothetical protein
MTYLKSFAMFESELINSDVEFDQVNEAAVADMAKALPADIKKAVKKLSKEEAMAAATELAKKLKLKVADLGNTEKVIAAMAKQSSMVAESTEETDDSELNEGISDWIKMLKAEKKKVGEWMSKGGLGTMAGGVLLTALNSPDQYIPSNVTVAPNLWATFGMAAIAAGFIAAIAGAKVSGTPVTTSAKDVIQQR